MGSIRALRSRGLITALAVALAATALGASVPMFGGRPNAARPTPATLTRAAAPSAPRAPRVKGGNGRVTVSWTAPLLVNGSPINAYLVWPYVGTRVGKAREFHSKKTTEVITGLPKAHRFTFRVAARNAIGIGPKSSASAAAFTGTDTHWMPSSAAPISWNWQLQGSVPTSTNVKVFDIDGFDNSAATVAALHARGTKVICYIDFGTAETFRPDYHLFPKSILGTAVDGFGGERWLDIRQLHVLEPIMTARMQMCVTKGFDALEPDNLDGYENSPGFPLTAQEQLTYNTWIATTAHSLGLSVGLKNDNDQTAQLEPHFDWALDEQCNQYTECDTERVFTDANKAVFNAEYQGGTGFCSADEAEHINGAFFSVDLDGSTYQPCSESW